MDPNANPSFDVATIKPQAPDEKGFAFLINHGNFIGKGLTLEKMMTISLNLNAAQIIGLPDWASQDKYNIDAKPDTPGQPSPKQFTNAVAKLAGERFGLKYHTEKRTMTAYSLTEAKGGIKMKLSTGGGDFPGFGLPPGRLFINNSTMKELAGFLQSDLFDHPVVDQTNLGTARYSGTLKYQMDDSQLLKMGMKAQPTTPDNGDTPPPLITALSQEFGLKIESGKIAVDVVVVDSVSKPTDN